MTLQTKTEPTSGHDRHAVNRAAVQPDSGLGDAPPDHRHITAMSCSAGATPVQLAALDTALLQFRGTVLGRGVEPARSPGVRATDMAGSLTASPVQLSALDGALLQFRSAVMARDGADIHDAAARGVAGSGAPLPHLETIQQSFGRHDVGQVQAHQGAAADSATQQLGARAYAAGDNVVLGAEGSDLHTVAHEAAHVVQQRVGVSLAGGVGQAGDRYEQHADAVADLVVAGKSAETVLDQMAGPSAGAAVQRSACEDVQFILTDNDEMGGDILDKDPDALISDQKMKDMEAAEKATEDRNSELVAIAERSRRPGRDPRTDAFAMTYKMLKWVRAAHNYEVTGVAYEQDLAGVACVREDPKAPNQVTVKVGDAFVKETTAENIDARFDELESAFHSLGTTASNLLGGDAALQSIELYGQLAEGTYVNAGSACVLVPEGGARVSVSLNAQELRLSVSPYILFDVLDGLVGATFHSVGFRFGEGGGLQFSRGKEFRTQGALDFVADLALDFIGMDMIHDVAANLVNGTIFTAPGFDPMKATPSEFAHGFDQVKANFDTAFGKKDGGLEEKTDEDSGGPEVDASPENLSDIGVKASVVYKPGYQNVNDGTGISLKENATFNLALQTIGNAGDGVEAAKAAKAGDAVKTGSLGISQIALGTPDGVKLGYKGVHIATFYRVVAELGLTIKPYVKLSDTNDIVRVLRKLHPNWFTQAVDETLVNLDAVAFPFYLLAWGLGVTASPGAELSDEPIRKAVRRKAEQYINDLAGYAASGVARNMLIDKAPLLQDLAKSAGFSMASDEILKFVGVKESDKDPFLEGVVESLKSGKGGSEPTEEETKSLMQKVDEMTASAGGVLDSLNAASEFDIGAEIGSALETVADGAKMAKKGGEYVGKGVAAMGDGIGAVSDGLDKAGETYDGMVDAGKKVGRAWAAVDSFLSD